MANRAAVWPKLCPSSSARAAAADFVGIAAAHYKFQLNNYSIDTICRSESPSSKPPSMSTFRDSEDQPGKKEFIRRTRG
jgi:hypothetical protein